MMAVVVAAATRRVDAIVAIEPMTGSCGHCTEVECLEGDN